MTPRQVGGQAQELYVVHRKRICISQQLATHRTLPAQCSWQ